MNYAIETLEKELERKKKKEIFNATDAKDCDDLWDAILLLKDER